ncbi:hypothetical protein INR49_000559 [Caranx melampygus]|nr:hypothetical protein INR49_000559 [Caranx melampygus]
MDFTAPVLFLVLMGTALGAPVCPKDCEIGNITHYNELYFEHVPQHQHTLTAPWDLTEDVEEGREPSVILRAKCKGCTVPMMTAKPIHLRIYVYQRIQNTDLSTNDVWCKCPYDLAVGCTCVKEK